MKLSLLSWKVRGMTIPGRKQFFGGVLQKVKPDVVFLQEVKSAGFELRNRMSYVWNGPFWNTDHSQGGGGVVLAICPYLQSLFYSAWMWSGQQVCVDYYFGSGEVVGIFLSLCTQHKFRSHSSLGVDGFLPTGCRVDHWWRLKHGRVGGLLIYSHKSCFYEKK